MFFYSKPGEIIVKQFKDDQLIELENEDDIYNIKSAVQSFELDRYLAPYDFKHYNLWKLSSNYISKSLLSIMQLDLKVFMSKDRKQLTLDK